MLFYWEFFVDFHYIGNANFDEFDNFAFSVYINVSSLNSCKISMELVILGCTHAFGQQMTFEF